jgi:hypothetical protein
MTLARAGILVAVAGGVALGMHVRLLAKQAQQRLDCAAWHRAQENIWHGLGISWGRRNLGVPEWNQVTVENALTAQDMESLWEAREVLAFDPQMVWALVPALRDPTFVGLRNPEGVHVRGREMPWAWCMTQVRDDLFRRAGRASWLLKQATGRDAPDVRVDTDRVVLADLARDWEKWLDALEGGAVCRK